VIKYICKPTFALTSLSGLDNIDANSINDLNIQYNSVLFECEVKSICGYLAGSDGYGSIADNALGCNSPEEVEQACDSASSVHEGSILQRIINYPNPFSTSTTIIYQLNHPETVIIELYNQLGNLVNVIEQNQSVGKQQVVWNAEGLPAGIYFCVLKTENGTQTMKMIKLK